METLRRQAMQFVSLWGTFLPMCTLFFFMAFINTIMDSLKDTLVITAVGGGAQVIPYLTVYAVFPVSLLFVLAYTFASRHFNRSKLFNLIIVVFAAFNLAFALFLYPNHQSLHLLGLGEKMAQVLPAGLDGFIGMIQNWTFTLFYCMSELWGDVGLSLLFWGFANEITKMENAKLLYPLFGIGANLAQTLGGLVLKFFSGQGGGDVSFASSLAKLMWMMMLCKGVVIALHFWIEQSSKSQRQEEREGRSGLVSDGTLSGPSLPMQKRPSTTIMENNRYWEAPVDGGHWHQNDCAPSTNGAVAAHRAARGGGTIYRVGNTIQQQASTSSDIHTVNKSPSIPTRKRQRSMREVLRILGNNPHIRALAIMAVAQSFAVNVMEFVWKSHVKLMYPTPATFTGFMGDVATATGLVTASLMVLSPIMFEKLGWAGVAGVTPNVLAYGGTAFFLLCFGYHAFASVGGWSTALLPAVALGGATLFVLARGAKFSLFKPAEEMVYICLDEDGRTSGKAAVDVVGAQFGKSVGSVSQQVLLLMSSGALFGIIPVIFVLYMLMLHEWEKAVEDLSDFQKERSSQPEDRNQGPYNGVEVTPQLQCEKRDTDPNAPRTLATTCS
ncbi:unnamed protein product [Ostreobium quekettii]|uniref:ADP,ATP carrier protein n=1 Tax=Ostreobium quekettii TaxID=121088 RepID=A0A8S1JGZ4_9CHLO|nr:unnamed protein product [Ostreobium quekettii]